MRLLRFAAAIVFVTTPLIAQKAPQTFPLRDAAGLAAPKVTTESVTYLGRKCVRMSVEGEDNAGLVLLPGTDFQDGVIEADIALKSNMPAGIRYPGFIGIAFRARADASHYELFYVRPGNADSPDQAQRNHSVQYVSEPDFGWYRLRREWPSIYETHEPLAFQTWIKLRIEVSGRAATLYLNGSSKPSLIVDGLKGEDLHGAVGLWGYTNEEAHFSNVRITPSAPQPIRNGSDIAGSWATRCTSDAGCGPATMDLHRDGNKVTGTWSGPLGTNLPVTGTWRNGYVDLSFAGDWPAGSRQGAPGPVRAFLSGWIDGDTAKGRMRVEGRSDGTWVGKRKEPLP